MSSYDTWHNLLSGISQGSFDKICIKDGSGAMTDILTLVASGGGAAGVTDVTSQSSELTVATNGTTRQLTLNLSAYASIAAMNTLLANYVLASAYNTAMSAKLDSLTATAPLVVTGTGTSRALTTLWKPSQITLEIGRAHV